MKICPHCGAEHGPGKFCPACGNRVAGRAPGALANLAIAVLVALVAAPLLIIGATMSLCGAVATVGALGGPSAAPAGLICLVIGLVLLWLVAKLLRAGEAHTSGHRTRTFGK